MIEHDIKTIACSLETIAGSLEAIAQMLAQGVPLPTGAVPAVPAGAAVPAADTECVGCVTDPTPASAPAANPQPAPAKDISSEIDYTAPVNYESISKKKGGRDVLKTYCAKRGIILESERRPTKNIIQDLKDWDIAHPYNPTPAPGIPAAEGAEIKGDTPEDVAAQLNTEFQGTAPVPVPGEPLGPATPTTAASPAAPAGAAAVTPVNPAPAAAPQAATPTTTPPAAAATPAPAATTPPVSAPVVPDNELTQQHVVSTMTKLIKSYETTEMGRQVVNEILTKTCGVTMASQVPEEQYPALYKALNNQLAQVTNQMHQELINA